MTRSALVLAICVGLSLLFTRQALADQAGDGNAHISRLPWTSSQAPSISLSTGWGGCTFAGTHCAGNPDQYAVDWATSGSFWALLSTEGGLSCVVTSTAGSVVTLSRIDGKFDKFLHLQSCPSATHQEQGDFLAIADGSGTSSSGPHLHFEVRNTSSGSTVKFGPSGLENRFCATALSAECGGVSYEGQVFISDNAGPGVNSAGNLTAWNNIATAHRNIGHYLCAGKAWDCFGSSAAWEGGPLPFEAKRTCLSTFTDCGWNQDFRNASWVFNNFSWPEACSSTSSAYWVPGDTYTRWLQLSLWAGQPRSNQAWNSFLGAYVQYFRYGLVLSLTFGGNGTWYASPTSTCLPP